MLAATSPASVAKAIQDMAALRIGIDGADGVGKSTLAAELATLLGLPVFHLDDFVAKHKGAYISQLNLASLQAALAEASRGFIVEGACLLRALGRAQSPVDATVYVMRVNETEWLDEEYFAPSLPIEEHLAALRRDMQAFVKSGPVELGLLEELVRYHAEFKPHEIAEVVYLRLDG